MTTLTEMMLLIKVLHLWHVKYVLGHAGGLYRFYAYAYATLRCRRTRSCLILFAHESF